MKIAQKTNKDQTATLTVDLKQKDYEEKVSKSLKSYAAKAELKGFRKGKVPAGLVKKMYGTAIMAEEINHMLSHKVNDYIREENLNILGQPLPVENETEIDIYNMGDLTFQYELGLSPEVDLSLLEKSPKFNKYVIEVDKDLVDKEIENMLTRFGEVQNPDGKAEGKDALDVTLEEVDDTGKVKEGGYSHTTAFGFDQLKLKKDQTAVGKLKVGESYDKFNVYKAFDKTKEEIAKTILELDPETIEAAGETFKLTLNKINRVGAAEMNQEFFDKVYGEGNVKTEEEYREKVKGELENYLEQAADNKLRADVFKKFSEDIKADLPDEFLKKWLKATREENVSAEEVEKEYESFAANLKTSLVFNAISEKGQLKVEAEELQNKVRETIVQQFQYYGMPITENEEMMEGMVQRFMSDEKQLRQTHDQLMDSKIFEFLKSKVKIADKKVTLDDFNKLNQ